MQSTLTARAGCTAFQASSQARSSRRRAVVTQATSDPLLQKPLAKPAAPAEASSSAGAAPAAAAAASASATTGVTIEYQRQQAKAMQKYFKSLKFNETVEKAKVFGWTKKNEINNGRWVMMGIAIGLMTEYATGVSFIDQLKLMASYMGLVDLD